jgi:hypothetical protein
VGRWPSIGAILGGRFVLEWGCARFGYRSFPTARLYAKPHKHQTSMVGLAFHAVEVLAWPVLPKRPGDATLVARRPRCPPSGLWNNKKASGRTGLTDGQSQRPVVGRA